MVEPDEIGLHYSMRDLSSTREEHLTGEKHVTPSCDMWEVHVTDRGGISFVEGAAAGALAGRHANTRSRVCLSETPTTCLLHFCVLRAKGNPSTELVRGGAGGSQ